MENSEWAAGEKTAREKRECGAGAKQKKKERKRARRVKEKRERKQKLKATTILIHPSLFWKITSKVWYLLYGE